MKIDIKGVIVSNDDQFVYDMFEMDSTSPKNVVEAIENADGQDLEVVINSGGGDVFSGSEIYSTLKEYPGNVNVKIIGVAASAASVIAMAGSKVSISPTASIMIHNAAMVNAGDYNSMDSASNMLKVINQTIAGAYQTKTGIEESELLDLMNKETWLSPNEAKEKGFVDEILFQNTKVAASVQGAIPQAVIDGLRNGLADKTNKKEDKKSFVTEALKDNEELIKNMIRETIDNELKQNKEPKQKPTSNMSKLFLI